MEKATIVSILPIDLHEVKHGIFPGDFKIKKSTAKLPSLLTVGRSLFYTYVGDNRGDTGELGHRDYIKRELNADIVANSVVNDYLDSQFLRKPGEQEPALFWVPEEVDYKGLLNKHEEKIASAVQNQNKWYVALVTEADDIWEKNRQHKLISGTHRMAATQLGLEKPWIIKGIQGQTLTTMRCAVCRTEIMVDAVVCPNCKCILKPEEYKKYAFVGV